MQLLSNCKQRNCSVQHLCASPLASYSTIMATVWLSDAYVLMPQMLKASMVLCTLERNQPEQVAVCLSIAIEPVGTSAGGNALLADNLRTHLGCQVSQ